MKKKYKHVTMRDFYLIKNALIIGFPWSWIERASKRNPQTIFRISKAKDIEEYRNGKLKVK